MLEPPGEIIRRVVELQQPEGLLEVREKRISPVCGSDLHKLELTGVEDGVADDVPGMVALSDENQVDLLSQLGDAVNSLVLDFLLDPLQLSHAIVVCQSVNLKGWLLWPLAP
jgi:hypothetical protein